MTNDSETVAVGKSGSSPMPPYTSFNSFKSAIAVLAEHGVPSRIDRSIWGTKYSGSVLAQVLTAHRFLRLIDGDGTPSDALRDLAGAYNKENWATVLRSILQLGYGPLMELDLQKATANQLYERFRTLYGADGDTGRKCVTFFLQAAQEAAIPVSAYLLTNSKPRSVGGQRRRVRLRETTADAAPPTSAQPSSAAPESLTDRLLSKFPEFDPQWPDDIKAKWFAGFAELMDRTKS